MYATPRIILTHSERPSQFAGDRRADRLTLPILYGPYEIEWVVGR